MSQPTLSILICHLARRRAMLERLHKVLSAQCPRDGQVELDLWGDNGELTTGAKRNLLLQHAKGRYVAMIDDDDLVSEDYIPRILEAVKSDPDVVGMEGIMTRNGQHPQKFIHSLRYDHWFDTGEFPNKTYYRCPNHLNPVRRELALQAGYPDLTHGEDHAYSNALRPLLKTEEYLEGPIYFYLADQPEPQ